MKNKQQKHRQMFRVLIAVAALAAWMSIPLISSHSKAESVPVLVRIANLGSPTGGVDPHGNAEFQVFAGGQREFEVEIEDVNLAAGTSLTVFVDGSSVGQLVLGTDRQGRLKLRTEDGQTVPDMNDGSVVQVRNGDVVLVSGALGTVANPGPTPSPTGSPNPSPGPTASPDENEIFATLSGGQIGGVVPFGYAEFEVEGAKTELEVRVRQINLPPGTVLSVVINSTEVGTFVLGSNGEGRLELRTDRGQTVPVVAAGDSIQIRQGSAALLSGTFGGLVNPTPTPPGTPGPTPSPSPARGRAFEAHLVAQGTLANGEFKVVLNTDETKATIFGEFQNLGSGETGARIETTTATPEAIFTFPVIGGTRGEFAAAMVNVTAAQVQQLRTGLWSAVITSVNSPNGEIRGQFTQHSHGGDFDGDGGNDLAVFRPSTGTWYSLNSAGFTTESLGTPQDTAVSADYDGDGRTDAAVFRPLASGAAWEIKRSSDGGTTTRQFGVAGDIPTRGDFDGDGRSDLAVFRPSNGTWYIQTSGNFGFNVVQFGVAGDIPAAGDMDGDGKDDIVVFRPSNGQWYWLGSARGTFNIGQFGVAGDIPVAGDFDGDGKNDLAVFRPSNGTWYSLGTAAGGFRVFRFGVGGDVPVAGDYDNDGRTDIAVFRPSDGNWYVMRSSDGGFQVTHFGAAGDIPAAAR